MKKLVFDEISKFTPSKGSILSGLRGLNELEHASKDNQLADTFNWKVLLFLLLIVVSFMLFVLRSINLQLVNNGKYIELADLNKTRNTIILAERGVIYSSDGAILARNQPSFAVELNRSLCLTICNAIVTKINDFVKLNPDIVKKALASPRADVILSNTLDKDAAVLLEANINQLPGVSVIIYPIRDYIYPEVFAHSIGYVGLDDISQQPNIIGKSGVEDTYNEYLAGIPGNRISEVDSTGKKYNVTSQEDSLPGRDLQLYINKDLSLKAYELLKKVVDEKKADAGVVVAEDPYTGGILALVSYPSFDANKISNGISESDYQKLLQDPYKPFFNRAISAVYPPGSTFKMITASAALSENVVDRYTTIFDPGYISVNGYRFNNWKLTGHGDVNIVRAIQVSNDTFFYTVGGGYGAVSGVGIDKLYMWARRFGIGNKTGIDIPGEVEGYMPDGKQRSWYLGDTYITAIGQGDVLTTPMQLNTVTSYFANGGMLVKPQLVKSVVGIKTFEPKIFTQNLISKKNYDIIREGLAEVVLPGGTAYPLFDFPQKHNGILLGGKTGTSEYTKPDGKAATHAWLTVFGPLNHANIALTVFLEGGGAGSDDAAPVARQLLDQWFSK